VTTLSAVGLVTVAAQPAAAGVTRVTICHQVGNGSYRVITVAASSLVRGHGHHSGDIIPSVTFTRGQSTIHVAGRNLGAIGPQGQLGSEILANGCRVPSVPAATNAPATNAPRPTASSPATTGATPTPAPTAAPGQTPTLAPNPQPTAAPGQTPTLAPQTTLAPGQTPTLAPTATPPEVPQLVPATLPGQTAPSLRPDTELTPLVECVVRRNDGVTVVWFDYELTGDQPVKVEWGSGNELAPSGLPPRLFGPGIHPRVVSVETTDGVASWNLGGRVATSDASTPDCESLVTDTTEPDTTQPPTTGPDTTAPGTTEPGTTDTTEPDTTGPDTTDTTDTTVPGTPGITVAPHGATTDTIPGSTPDGCEPGEVLADDGCEPLEPIRLVLVDNVIDCSGFGIATFAAINDNEFALTDDDIESELTPARLDGVQPTRVGIDTIATPDGTKVSETFEVAYVSAVTWRLTHHGLTSTISAGAGGARTLAECPLALLETTGSPGTLEGPGSGQLVTVGSSNAPIALFAFLSMLAGGALIAVARRRDRVDPVAT